MSDPTGETTIRIIPESSLPASPSPGHRSLRTINESQVIYSPLNLQSSIAEAMSHRRFSHQVFTVYFKICGQDDQRYSAAAIEVYLKPEWTLDEVQNAGRALQERMTSLGVSMSEDAPAAMFAEEMKRLAQKMDTWCFELTARVRPELMEELRRDS